VNKKKGKMAPQKKMVMKNEMYNDIWKCHILHKMWQLQNCRIIKQIMEIFHNRHIYLNFLEWLLYMFLWKFTKLGWWPSPNSKNPITEGSNKVQLFYIFLFENSRSSNDNRVLTFNENLITESSQINNQDILTYSFTLRTTQILSLLLNDLNKRWQRVKTLEWLPSIVPNIVFDFTIFLFWNITGIW